MKKQDMVSSVAVMFEELKQRITDLDAKLEKSKDSNFTEYTQSSIDKKELMQLVKEQQAEEAFHTKKVIGEELKGIENRLMLRLDKCDQGVGRFQSAKYPYFGSMKTGILSLIFIVAFLLLLWGFVYQWTENVNLSQNDLKYRYIKISGEIDKNAFQRLEKFFQEENAQSIEDFRLEVEKREKTDN